LRKSDAMLALTRRESAPVTDEAFVQVEIPEELWPGYTDDRMPKKVKDALEKDCLMNCGDYFLTPTYQQVDGEWYVLAEDTFYQLQGDRLVMKVIWSVTVDRTIYYE